MASQRGESLETATPRRKGLDKSHYLYIAVIAAVVLGAVVGLLFRRWASPSSPWATASSSSSR